MVRCCSLAEFVSASTGGVVFSGSVFAYYRAQALCVVCDSCAEGASDFGCALHDAFHPRCVSATASSAYPERCSRGCLWELRLAPACKRCALGRVDICAWSGMPASSWNCDVSLSASADVTAVAGMLVPLSQRCYEEVLHKGGLE